MEDYILWNSAQWDCAKQTNWNMATQILQSCVCCRTELEAGKSWKTLNPQVKYAIVPIFIVYELSEAL